MRWFCIGNGPSLAKMNLDLLLGEKTVALNRIHLAYPSTDWRPTVYIKTDHNHRLLGVYNEENKLNVNESSKSYLWDGFRCGLPNRHPNHIVCPTGMGNHPKVTWVTRCEHHYWWYYSREDKRANEWHLPELCTAYSGIGVAMQVAVLEGATEIYLIGCDLGYGKEVGQDHFSPSYSLNKKKLGDFDIGNVDYCHQVAKRSSPIPIFNATIGGDLEVYPRVNYEEIIRNS